MEEKESSSKKRHETFNTLHLIKRKTETEKGIKYAVCKVNFNLFIDNVTNNFDFESFTKENLQKIEPVSILYKTIFFQKISISEIFKNL